MNTKWLTARYAVLQIAYWGAYCALSGYAAVFLTGKGFLKGAPPEAPEAPGH